MMHGDIDRVLLTESQIAQRVAELARQITSDYATSDSIAPQITILPILTGAMIFASDLIRHLPMRMKIGLLTVSSYPGRTIQSQGVNILASQIGNIAQRHVLLVDDILDTGQTLNSVHTMLRELKPASLRTCVLLRKNTPGAARIALDYFGFEIPNEFVVGYGLDFDDHYRNLPYVATLKKHLIGRNPPDAA